MMKTRFKAILSTILVASLAWMCSEDNNNGTSELSGTAVKGIVSNATVEVYALTNNGLKDVLLSTATTNSDGNFSVAIEHQGPVEVIVTGGSYTDEASGETVEIGDFQLRNILMAEGSVSFGVTALTTIAAEHINAHASEGLATAIENANQELANTFGLNNVDISGTIPSDLTLDASLNAGQAELFYGAVQAGLSELMLSGTLSASDLPILIEEMASDFSDGVFDGKSGDTALQFTLTITPAQAMQGLDAAIESFLNGPRNASNLKPVDLPF